MARLLCLLYLLVIYAAFMSTLLFFLTFFFSFRTVLLAGFYVTIDRSSYDEKSGQSLPTVAKGKFFRLLDIVLWMIAVFFLLLQVINLNIL